MSSTVVGACILCALLLGHKSLQSNAAITSSGDFLPSLVPRAMMPISSVTITQDHGDYLSSTASFTPMVLDDSASREQFLIDGSLSTRMCLSEGKDESKCLSLLMKCEACGHTTSRSNALPPRKFEEHVYNDCDGAASRVDPEVFREALLSRLPMLVNITGFDIEQLKMPKGVDNPLNWEQWVSGAQSTLASDGIPTEFRFRRLDRTHIWTALYYSECNARLEARVTKSSVTWLLFFAPIQATGPLKAQFNRPLARMIATSPGSIPLSLMDGQWELSLPVTSRVPLIIANVGDTTIKSWRNRLGLEGGLENEYQYETLRIQIDNSKDHIDELTKSSIDGDYVSLKNCGGPCGSLRKRINDDGQEPMFFFLSSGRNTLPKHNAYMFSRTCHRTTYGEYREILLQTDEESGYCPVFTENKSIHGKLNPTVAIGMVHGRWLVALSAFMSKSYRTTMEVTSPKSFPIWTMGPGSHRLCTEVLSGNFSVRSTDKLFVRCSKFGGHVELNLQKSKQILGDLAFATTRLPLPDAFQNDQWVSLKSNLVSDAAIEGDTVCRKCAPQRPQVKWSLVKTGNRTTFIPIEDGREAAVFERALKARPQPWLVRLSVENDTNEFHVDPSLSFTIACNTTSLVQSALGMFPRETLARLTLIDFPEKTPNATTSTCTFKWRIVRHFEKFFTGFPKLCFSSNKLDACSEQPPHFQKHKLRMEQLRSLSWMISQEATKEPFLEEEVTEAVLPCLDMRAEGLVQRPILVRGGIIADEVRVQFRVHDDLVIGLCFRVLILVCFSYLLLRSVTEKPLLHWD